MCVYVCICHSPWKNIKETHISPKDEECRVRVSWLRVRTCWVEDVHADVG